MPRRGAFDGRQHRPRYHRRAGFEAQRRQILTNRLDGPPVALQKKRVPRPPAKRLDPHRAGSRIRVHKGCARHPRRQNIEQRLAQPVRRGTRGIARECSSTGATGTPPQSPASAHRHQSVPPLPMVADVAHRPPQILLLRRMRDEIHRLPPRDFQNLARRAVCSPPAATAAPIAWSRKTPPARAASNPSPKYKTRRSIPPACVSSRAPCRSSSPSPAGSSSAPPRAPPAREAGAVAPARSAPPAQSPSRWRSARPRPPRSRWWKPESSRAPSRNRRITSSLSSALRRPCIKPHGNVREHFPRKMLVHFLARLSPPGSPIPRSPDTPRTPAAPPPPAAS